MNINKVLLRKQWVDFIYLVEKNPLKILLRRLNAHFSCVRVVKHNLKIFYRESVSQWTYICRESIGCDDHNILVVFLFKYVRRFSWNWNLHRNDNRWHIDSDQTSHSLDGEGIYEDGPKLAMSI